jgi:hypothetical protein
MLLQALMREFIEQREYNLDGGDNGETVRGLLIAIKNEIDGILEETSSGPPKNSPDKKPEVKNGNNS